MFLVKVHNEAGINPQLEATSPNAQLPYSRSLERPASRKQDPRR